MHIQLFWGLFPYLVLVHGLRFASQPYTAHSIARANTLMQAGVAYGDQGTSCPHNLRLRGGSPSSSQPEQELDHDTKERMKTVEWVRGRQKPHRNREESTPEPSKIARMQQQLDQANAERDCAIAQTKQAIAEKDCAIAQTKQAIAEKDRQLDQAIAEKDCAVKQRDRSIAQIKGSFFLTFESLESKDKAILDRSDPALAGYFEEIQKSNSLLKLYVPDNRGASKIKTKNSKRQESGLAECKFTHVNVPRLSKDSCEAAHIMPFARRCHRSWEKLNRFRLDMPEVSGSMQYDLWLYGYTAGTKNKVIHSGYLHSAANFMAIPNQHKWFDEKPSVMWLPLHRTAKELWGFSSNDVLEYIVICSDETCYVKVGANFECDETSWISSDHPDVESAFEVFAEVMSAVIGIVRDDDHSKAPEADNVRKFRNYLKVAKVFQTPCLKSGCNGYFLKVKLDSPRVCAPGKQVEQWDRFTAHPSPDPISLMCRCYSAFTTCLLKKDALHGIKISKEDECCKLFPSCLDFKGATECVLCQANALLHNPHRVPYLSSAHYSKLLAITRLQGPDFEIH